MMGHQEAQMRRSGRFRIISTGTAVALWENGFENRARRMSLCDWETRQGQETPRTAQELYMDKHNDTT